MISESLCSVDVPPHVVEGSRLSERTSQLHHPHHGVRRPTRRAGIKHMLCPVFEFLVAGIQVPALHSGVTSPASEACWVRAYSCEKM